MVIIKSNKCVICHKEKENTYGKFCIECSEDENKLKKYYDNLEKRRKYTKGESIHSLDELLKQEFVYWHDKIYHIGWVKSWQLNFVQNQLNRKTIQKAIKKESLETPPTKVFI